MHGLTVSHLIFGHKEIKMANEYIIHVNGELHSTHDDQETAHNTIMAGIADGSIKPGTAFLGIPYPGGTTSTSTSTVTNPV